MRGKDDFVRRWRHRLAGLAMYAYASEAKDGPLAKVERMYDIPAEVERMLALMYDDLTADETPTTGTPRPHANVGRASDIGNGATPRR